MMETICAYAAMGAITALLIGTAVVVTTGAIFLCVEMIKEMRQ